MIYYVECGVELTNEYGDIDESYYSSVENVYENAVQLMGIYSLHDKFQARAIECR